MQAVQLCQRNRARGYFIAEANPGAASQAITRRYARHRVGWAILATDGAADPLLYLGLANWSAIAADPTQASRLLHRAAAWEEHADPNGSQFPRAKRHDEQDPRGSSGASIDFAESTSFLNQIAPPAAHPAKGFAGGGAGQLHVLVSERL